MCVIHFVMGDAYEPGEMLNPRMATMEVPIQEGVKGLV